MKENNPLLCDPKTGVCEPNQPNSLMSERLSNVTGPSSVIRVIYFTDPICSSCWGIEAQLRKLKVEYGAYIDIEYRMGGLLPSWEIYNSGGISEPRDVAVHWDEMSEIYQMPIDGDLWLEDPLNSSYPPSIAFKAAQVQDETKAMLFLRRIKEMVFVEKRNIAKWEVLKEAAKECGLDTEKLFNDIDGVGKLLFKQDLELGNGYKVRGFPTLFFQHKEKQEVVYGSRPYQAYEEMVLTYLPNAEKQPFEDPPIKLFEVFSSMTTKEFALLANEDFKAAETLLQQWASQGKVERITIANGDLWRVIKE